MPKDCTMHLVYSWRRPKYADATCIFLKTFTVCKYRKVYYSRYQKTSKVWTADRYMPQVQLVNSSRYQKIALCNSYTPQDIQRWQYASVDRCKFHLADLPLLSPCLPAFQGTLCKTINNNKRKIYQTSLLQTDPANLLLTKQTFFKPDVAWLWMLWQRCDLDSTLVDFPSFPTLAFGLLVNLPPACQTFIFSVWKREVLDALASLESVMVTDRLNISRLLR